MEKPTYTVGEVGDIAGPRNSSPGRWISFCELKIALPIEDDRIVAGLLDFSAREVTSKA